jgi:hypothetical protein
MTLCKTYFITKSANFWDITPCSPSSVNRRFGGTYRLHLQGQRISLARKPCLAPAFTLVPCSSYFFDPEDVGDKFLRNVG